MRTGWVEAGAIWTRTLGAEAYAELGYRPLERLALFGRGFINQKDAGVMAGVRWTF